MRKLFALFVMALLCFVACESVVTDDNINNDGPGNDSTIVTPHLSVTSDSIIRMTYLGGKATIDYTIEEPCEGVELAVVPDVDWIDYQIFSNNIALDIKPNSDSQQRVGVVTLTYGEEVVEVFVEQGGMLAQGEVRLNLLSERKMTYDANGGDGEILYSLETSNEGAVVEVDADAEWIGEFVVEADKVGFVVAKNTTIEQRTAHIVLSYETTSATVTVVQDGISNEVLLSAKRKIIEAGEAVEFVAMQANEDVTAVAKYFDYYTREEVSNPYTIAEAGERVFYATCNGETSKVLTINIIPAGSPAFPEDSDPDNFTFKHRMLLIDHTGTDCGFCPNMMVSLKTLSQNSAYNDTYNIAMAHSYNTGDKAFSLTARTLFNFFNKTTKVATGYPTLTFNYWYNDSSSSNINYIYTHLQKNMLESQDVAAAVSTAVKGDDVLVSVALKSERDRTYRINIFLLEDDVYSYQYNATENWMHYHENAIRSSYFTLDYTDISGGEWGYVGKNSTTYKVFTMPTESSWVKSNLKVLVIIAAQNSNNKFDVVNTTMCPINGSVPFDYK
ncbi:MAG: Omp28-related outer membrane protein [Alistipes sp.]|nr:Omp28-related outer membrane protein [Alistipes sp.]